MKVYPVRNRLPKATVGIVNSKGIDLKKGISNEVNPQICKTLKITRRPFKELAAKTGISEKEVIRLLKEYKQKKYIRRFGAVVNHNKIGLKAAALVCWKIEKNKVAFILRKIKDFPAISHCYLRKEYKQWPYNFYTMIHASTKKECLKIIENFSRAIKVDRYKALFTLKEFKKVSSYWLYEKL